MDLFFVLRKYTLVHTFIHLRSYFLPFWLGVCISNQEEVAKWGAVLLQQNRQNHWLTQKWLSTSVGHLAAPGEQMRWTIWGSMAKCCHLELLPVNVS